MSRGIAGIWQPSTRRRAGTDSCFQPPPASDAELLARFSTQRDQQAFEEIVRRHGAVVMGVCRRVLDDPYDAEDAFQATFLVLAQKSTHIRKPELLSNWLYGVAFRIARKARNKQPKCTAMPAAEPAAVTAAPDAAFRELQSVIDAELQRLPDRYRLLLTLCYFQGLTHAQIARQLGWRPGSVSRRLAKAHQLLRARLKRRGMALSAGLLALLLGQMGTAAPISAVLVQSTTHAANVLAAGSELTSVVTLRVAALARTVVSTPLTLLVVLLASLLFIGPCGLAIQAGRAPDSRAAASETGEHKQTGDHPPAGDASRAGTDPNGRPNMLPQDGTRGSSTPHRWCGY